MLHFFIVYICWVFLHKWFYNNNIYKSRYAVKFGRHRIIRLKSINDKLLETVINVQLFSDWWKLSLVCICHRVLECVAYCAKIETRNKSAGRVVSQTRIYLVKKLVAISSPGYTSHLTGTRLLMLKVDTQIPTSIQSLTRRIGIIGTERDRRRIQSNMSGCQLSI